MAKRKGLLQKVSTISAVISFILAIISAVLLYLRVESVGTDNPISASLMASTFFFICVGVVLYIIGSTNMPSFKFKDPDEK